MSRAKHWPVLKKAMVCPASWNATASLVKFVKKLSRQSAEMMAALCKKVAGIIEELEQQYFARYDYQGEKAN
ncbi:MAG: hypothetical protein M0C28_26080 [Candidatus Moduliflexus flocculans]|nr:hypothetical protein [Candidatus Moduliflexus flocculans]